MPTLKKRLNISLSEELEGAITKLAERDNMPEATKAAHLLQLGLEIEEDQVWDAIAASRDTEKASFVTHKKIWA